MSSEREREDDAQAPDPTRPGLARYLFAVGGRAVEVEVQDVSEDDWARHGESFGPPYSTARFPGRVQVVRLIL